MVNVYGSRIKGGDMSQLWHLGSGPSGKKISAIVEKKLSTFRN